MDKSAMLAFLTVAKARQCIKLSKIYYKPGIANKGKIPQPSVVIFTSWITAEIIPLLVAFSSIFEKVLLK